jgi:prephenate dehydrogenase
MSYNKVTIIGMGLIGGALGMDLKKKRLAKEVCAWGRNEAHLKQALNKGACDTITDDIIKAIENAEIVIFATPPKVIINQLHDIKTHLKEGMLLMDVGSIKGSITEASEELRIFKTGAEFVGCHPMAGSEKTGVLNAQSGIFKDAPCIITPESNNTVDGVESAKIFWENLGSKVVIMDPYEHDMYVGFISHLPHVISSTIMNTSADKLKHIDMIAQICGPSFTEITRVAGSSEQMWSQIYLENRKQVLLAIDTFIENLEKFKEFLINNDNKKLEKYLKKAKDAREKVCK